MLLQKLCRSIEIAQSYKAFVRLTYTKVCAPLLKVGKPAPPIDIAPDVTSSPGGSLMGLGRLMKSKSRGKQHFDLVVN